MEPNTTGKRIVSKGEYAAVQTSRALLRTSAVVSLVEVVICVGLAIGLPLSYSGVFTWVMALCFAIMAFRLGRGGLGKLRQAAQLEQVLPLTQANAPLLPLRQTLVRASAPSPQEMQNILLRATTGDQKTPAEQLLRSSAEAANAADLPALDTLEPASEEQPQPRNTISLHSVSEVQEKREEELIQMTNGQE